MYSQIRPHEPRLYRYNDFKLCYIEKIPEISLMEDFQGVRNYDDDNIHLKLFFTNYKTEDQWGDDWNDAPYEYNSGRPYDYHYVDGQCIKHEIITIDYTLKSKKGSGSGLYYKLPEDYSYNSPFSVEMINAGLVAWLAIYCDCEEAVPGHKFVLLYGGEPMFDVMDKLNAFIV